MAFTTRKMSDAHEDWLATLLGGYKTKGSGNQWHSQMDGGLTGREHYWTFKWDGKSTLGNSIGITRAMWEKAREQSIGHHPILPLRWYANERLDVLLDLGVVDMVTLQGLIEDANTYRAAKEQGCFTGSHKTEWPDSLSTCVVCGADMYDTVADGC